MKVLALIIAAVAARHLVAKLGFAYLARRVRWSVLTDAKRLWVDTTQALTLATVAQRCGAEAVWA